MTSRVSSVWSEDRAVINRYGFNNTGWFPPPVGLTAFVLGGGQGIVGVNIGANKDSTDRIADYQKAPPDWPGTQITSPSMYHRQHPRPARPATA